MTKLTDVCPDFPEWPKRWMGVAKDLECRIISDSMMMVAAKVARTPHLPIDSARVLRQVYFYKEAQIFILSLVRQRHAVMGLVLVFAIATGCNPKREEAVPDRPRDNLEHTPVKVPETTRHWPRTRRL